MLLEPCFSVTLHDERGGVPIKCSWSNAFLSDRRMTLHEKRGGNPMLLLLGLCLCMTPQDARGERVSMKCSCI